MIVLRLLIGLWVLSTLVGANAFYSPEEKDYPDDIHPEELPQDWRGNRHHESFYTAKRLLEQEVFGASHQTMYCNCTYTVQDDETTIDFTSCGFLPRDGSWSARDKRVEWEHVLPASHIGHFGGIIKRAWEEGHEKCITSTGNRYKGRRCAQKVSRRYRLMQADMHNLWPAVGSINGLRSNRQMAEIEGEDYEFGSCDAEFARGIFEPREAVRGEIARTYLYMEWAYPGFYAVDEDLRTQLETWAAQDPVSPSECLKESRIAKVQGNSNPFTARLCRESATASAPATAALSAPVMDSLNLTR